MLKGLTTAEICTAVVLLYYLITLKELQFEKFFFSSIWNLETVCQYIDSLWQVFSLRKSECLTQPIQMKLSPKLKMCSHFFSGFLKSTSNFEDFEKMDELHSWCISEIIDCKKRGYLNS